MADYAERQAQKLTCIPVSLNPDQIAQAAQRATLINGRNVPHPLAALAAASPEGPLGHLPPIARIAVVTNKYWHSGGKDFAVYFMDNPPFALRTKILSHMNAWSTRCNVSFRETQDASQGEVRISRGTGGYWSYIGTDILSIPGGQQTMNLEGFTMNTEDSEFYRVVRHETGHTLGCPHEHMRQQLIDDIDVQKAITYFQATQGWNEAMTRQQVLTPLDQASIMGTPNADSISIMCYQIPGAITKTGQPILGGSDIDPTDYAFMATIYPKPPAATAPGAAGRAPAVGQAQPASGAPAGTAPGATARPGPAGVAAPDAGVLIQLPSGVDLTLPPEATQQIIDRLFPSPPDAGSHASGPQGAASPPAPPQTPAAPPAAPERTEPASAPPAHAPVRQHDPASPSQGQGQAQGQAQGQKVVTQSAYAKAIFDAGVSHREQDEHHHDIPANGQTIRNCVLAAIGALGITAANKPTGGIIAGAKPLKTGPQAAKIVKTVSDLHGAAGGQIGIVFIGESHDSASDGARARDVLKALSDTAALHDVTLVLERGLTYEVPQTLTSRIREETLTSLPGFDFGVDKLEPDNRTIVMAGYMLALAASGDQIRDLVFVVLCGDRHQDLAAQFEYLASSAGRFGVDWVEKRPRAYYHAPPTQPAS